MIVNCEGFEIEVNDTLVYEESEHSGTCTSYSYLTPEVKELVAELTADIREKASKLQRIINEAPTDNIGL